MLRQDIGRDECYTTATELPHEVLSLILKEAIKRDFRLIGILRCVCKAFQTSVQNQLKSLDVLVIPNYAVRKKALAINMLQSLAPFCQNVHTTNCSNCYSWMEDEALVCLSQNFHKIKAIYLNYCNISSKGIEALTENVSDLEVLSLISCHDIGDGASLAKLEKLQSLNLAWCHSVDASKILPLPRDLQEATFHGCDLINDMICYALPAAQSVNLAFTSVGDTGLLALAARSPHLRRLSLNRHGTSNVWSAGKWTPDGLREFQRRRPDVEVIMLTC